MTSSSRPGGSAICGRRRRGPAGSRGRPVEQVDDLPVGGLREVRVELADREEVRRCVQTDDLVGGTPERLSYARRTHRHREDDAGGTLRPGDLTGGAGRRTGRDAVVDHDHRAPGQRGGGPVTAEPARATLELGALAVLDLRELLLAYQCLANHPLVHDPHTALADSAHAELRLERDAELADDNHIERGAERRRNLEGDRHPAAGQTHHHGVPGRLLAQRGPKAPARVGTVGETHDDLLTTDHLRLKPHRGTRARGKGHTTRSRLAERARMPQAGSDQTANG